MNCLRRVCVAFLIVFILATVSLPYMANSVFADDSMPEIASPAAVLIDNYTGSVLYNKNMDNRMYPASTTKILTAILSIENCQLSDMATASQDAITSVLPGYSIGDIKVGESLTVQNLLEVLMVHSANDAANVLAEHVGGSIENFANMMNEKANEIGCKNSHFLNPSGKQEDDHYSSAHDLALIMRYCMKNSTFRHFSSLRSCVLPATSFAPERDFNTTVDILVPNSSSRHNYYYPYAIAGKTGFTTEAGNCLVSVAKKDNMELTCVILGAEVAEDGSSIRSLNTIDLYEYGFNNFKIDTICKKDDVAQNYTIKNASEETRDLPLVFKEDVKVLANASENLDSIEPNISLDQNLKAPISANQKVGTATYTVDGISYSTDILASHDVEKSIYSDLIVKIGIACAVLIILALVVVLIRSVSKHM